MRYLRKQAGRTRWGACCLALCASLLFSFLVTAAPPEGDGMLSLRLTPKAYMTNALVVTNPSTGTAVFAITVTGALEINNTLKWDNIATKTTTYNPAAATTDGILLMNTSGGAFTYTLPTADCDAAADVGRTIEVKCIGSCGGLALTIATEAAETIDGAATATIATNYGARTLLCGAADTWYIL